MSRGQEAQIADLIRCDEGVLTRATLRLGMIGAVSVSCHGQDQYTGKRGCIQLAEGTGQGGRGGGERREIVGDGAAYWGEGGPDGFDPERDGGGAADVALTARRKEGCGVRMDCGGGVEAGCWRNGGGTAVDSG